MRWFYNLKISVKLIVSFIIVAIISGVVGVIGISNITRINYNDTVLYENMTVPLSEVADMARWFQRARVNARDLILYDDPDDNREAYEEVQTYLNNVDVNAESFEKTIIQEEVLEYFQMFEEAMDKFRKDIDILLEICLENRDDEAFAFTKGEMQIDADEVRESVDKLIELKVNGAQNQTHSNDAAANTAVVTMLQSLQVPWSLRFHLEYLSAA